MGKLQKDNYLQKSDKVLHGHITRVVKKEALPCLILRPQDNHKNAGQSPLLAANFIITHHNKMGIIPRRLTELNPRSIHTFLFFIIQVWTYRELLMTSYLVIMIWINILIVWFFIHTTYKCCTIHKSIKSPTSYLNS